MKKQLTLWMVFAFVFSFLCACSAYTPGPSTTRSQAAPMTVPTTPAVETTEAPTTTEEQTEEYQTWAGVTTAESESETEAKGEILYVTNGVNIRAKANKNAEILGTFKVGEAVEKVGQEGSWVQIKYEGGEDGTAFVFQDYLSPEPQD